MKLPNRKPTRLKEYDYSQNGAYFITICTQNHKELLCNIVGAFKRFTNKKYGKNIWQRSFYDHIIRGEEDFREIWDYIDRNSQKWRVDRFYKGENNDISS